MFKQYYPIAEAVSALLYPHAEVVIHDLKTGRIAAIFNSFSKRVPGDESLLEEISDFSNLPDFFPPYEKINWDGRRLKSVTSTIRDAKGHPIGLFCINLDISRWEEMQNFIQSWLQFGAAVPESEILFKDDWREKINAYVSNYLKEKNLTVKALSKEKKKELVYLLREKGAFEAKNAALYIAKVLGISRASIYNYLKD